MTNGGGKSDGPVVPKTASNKDSLRREEAETPQERGPAKDNACKAPWDRTQSRASLDEALARVRRVAQTRKEETFTALFHHVYRTEALHQAYLRLRPDAASGIDGVTWQQYGQQLEVNLHNLSDRLRNNAYQPPPVRRVFLPKPDGRQRPIGIPTLEDKVVQGAMREALQAIWETEFVRFSYGARPKRSQHQALDALYVGMTQKKVNVVLDADLQGFFDTIDPAAMVSLIEQRVTDPRVLRLLRQWMSAGVLNDGVIEAMERGVPQGGSISPLLANIYLHYVFDLWTQRWRKQPGRGDGIVVRYVDDFIVGFQHEADATQFLRELKERLASYGLALHPDKTRILEFGRFAAEQRKRRGEGKPPTFDFLGFTHVCGTDRHGRFSLVRLTSRKKLRGKLQQLKGELRRRAFRARRQIGPWLRAVVQGHYNYYGVPLNFEALARFRIEVIKRWLKALRRLSQKTRMTWKRMWRLANKWLPRPRITHPFPNRRLIVNIQGKSPVR